MRQAGTITKRTWTNGKTVWDVAYWVKEDDAWKKVRKYGFKRKGDARTFLTSTLGAIQSGTYVKPTNETLSEYLDKWVEVPDVKDSTRASYRLHIRRHIAPALGQTRLQDLSVTQVKLFYSSLVKGGKDRPAVSPATARRIHATLHQALRAAWEDGDVTRNVTDLAKKRLGKIDRTKPVTWTSDEVEAFLRHTASDRLSALWLLANTTGMRRGEILGLAWEAVDLDAGRMEIRQTLTTVEGVPVFGTPKSHRSVRPLRLDARTVDALRSHKARQSAEKLKWGPAYHDGGLVFAQANGRAIHPDNLSRDFRDHVKAAKLPTIRLHDLRHTYGTRLSGEGIAAEVIAARLGHASVQFTLDVYVHPGEDRDQEAADKGAKAIGGSE